MEMNFWDVSPPTPASYENRTPPSSQDDRNNHCIRHMRDSHRGDNRNDGDAGCPRQA